MRAVITNARRRKSSVTIRYGYEALAHCHVVVGICYMYLCNLLIYRRKIPPPRDVRGGIEAICLIANHLLCLKNGLF